MPLNSDIPWPSIEDATARVLDVQRKLHRWSKADKQKRFDDLFNLVCDRATLVVAWDRVRSNRGSRTAGTDGMTKYHIEQRIGVARFLDELRESLRARTYQPRPVKQHGIPKANGKVRYLGIPTIRDRVVQMALKLVLEPIFEVDFCPTSYGYRPARRAQDAIAEIVHYINPPSQYEYVIEGDIKACFDNVHHGVLLTLVRERIKDRKVMELVKASLRAGVMKSQGQLEPSVSGTPQGGIISPLLANIYLSVLDRHFERAWKHQTRYIGCATYYRRRGFPTYRMVRYADDFVVLVRGTRQQAEAIRDEAAQLLRSELKMELSPEKTLVTHVDDGFNFLGHHVQRRPWKGALVGWTRPSRKSLAMIKHKVKTQTNRSTTYLSLADLLRSINPVLRGWSTYFRYDAAKRTLAYVDHFAWWRVFRWFRKKHPKRTWGYLKQRYCGGGWAIGERGVELFRPSKVKVERYRYRGAKILLPWMEPDELGPVGRFAKAAAFDESATLGALQEKLVPRKPTSARGEPDAR